MNNLGVKGCTKVGEAQEHDEQFGENDGAPTTNNQKQRKIGNTRIHKVPAMNPGLVKIIEKVTTI
jgi:hypothetical protein